MHRPDFINSILKCDSVTEPQNARIGISAPSEQVKYQCCMSINKSLNEWVDFTTWPTPSTSKRINGDDFVPILNWLYYEEVTLW